MLIKIGNKKYFYGTIYLLYLVAILYGTVFSLLLKHEFLLIYFLLFSTIIILPSLFIIEKNFAFSFLLEKILYVEKLNKKNWHNIFKLLSLLLSSIPLSFLFFYIADILQDKQFFNITFNQDNIISYLGISINFFITLLALHWTVVATIFSTKYSKSSKEIQELYFKHTKTKNISYYTSSYLLMSIIAYYYLATFHLNNEQTIFTSLAFVVELQKIIPSLLTTENQLTFIGLFFISISCILLYYYISNSINFIQLSNSYFLYNIINNEIKFIIQKSAFLQSKSNYEKNFWALCDYISLLYNKIKYDIKNKEATDKTYIEASIGYLQLIKIYWENKDKFFYDTDWYPSVTRPNPLAEVIFSGNNIVLTRDNLYVERLLLEINDLIVDFIIKSNNFSLLNIYYIKLREILPLQEKENLLVYNIPFLYETLKFLLTKINNNCKQIFTQKYFNNNEQDINFYTTISTLNTVLDKIFMTSQAYLFKFDKTQINTIIPTYKELKQVINIQELLKKYPTVNNEEGVKTYIKIFIERNVEHNFITSEKDFFEKCNLPLIQTELNNILRLFKSVEDQLKENLTFFAEQKSPHYFFDTFFRFLTIKHQILVNYNIYQTNYKEHFNNFKENKIIPLKIQLLFYFREELLSQLTRVIKIYQDEKYFTQREFPNLLNNIYELLLYQLIFYLNHENLSSQEEIKNTIKITFHFMLTVQQILTLELEELKKEQITISAHYDENFYINYYSAFIQFAAIIGSGLQKIGNNNLYDINSAFSDILAADDIRNYFQPFIDSIFHNNTVSFHFYPLIQPIEHEMQSQNSLIFFLKFIQAKLKEYSNDK